MKTVEEIIEYLENEKQDALDDLKGDPALSIPPATHHAWTAAIERAEVCNELLEFIKG